MSGAMGRIGLAGWAALALAGTALAGAGQAGASGAERLEAFLAEIRTLQADFRQSLYDEDGNRLETSRGRLYVQRPERFRWEYLEPYRQTIVADGQRLWIYDEGLAQVTVKRLDEAVGMTPAALLSAEQPLEQALSVEDLGERRGLDWVELRPKAPEEASFSHVRVGLEQDVLRRMELVDNFGQITELRFSEVEKNPELDPALFSFSPPEGVDVIGDVPPAGASDEAPPAGRGAPEPR